MPKGDMTAAEYLTQQKRQKRQRMPKPPSAPPVLPTCWQYCRVAAGLFDHHATLEQDILGHLERIRALSAHAGLPLARMTLVLHTPQGDLLALTDMAPGQLTDALALAVTLDKQQSP